jgi:hypothetical protein
MKRFFAFGCSMTSFAWPSWADLIAYHNKADEYYNFGNPGSGNRTIMQAVYEADELLNLQSGDTALVMLTSPWRNDTFIRGEWQPRGSVYNDAFGDHYTPDWMSKFWSVELGLMTTWLAAKSIREFLTYRQVNFKILPALPYKIEPSEFFDGSIPTTDVSLYNIEKYLDVTNTLWNFVRTYPFSLETKYWFNDMNCYDVHPTVVEHASYIKEYLPEYYSEDLMIGAKEVHSIMEPESHKKNYFKQEIQKYMGKRLGSIASKPS